MIGLPPGPWRSVCWKCCVSGRGLCDELITRPEESYRLWCIMVCDLETSWMRRPWPTVGCRAKNKQKNLIPWGCINRNASSFIYQPEQRSGPVQALCVTLPLLSIETCSLSSDGFTLFSVLWILFCKNWTRVWLVVQKTVGHLCVLGLQVANCSGWRLCVGYNSLCSATDISVNTLCSKNFTYDFIRWHWRPLRFKFCVTDFNFYP